MSCQLKRYTRHTVGLAADDRFVQESLPIVGALWRDGR